MNYNHQVCSLNLSIRLQKLGVKQESLFWYVYFDDTEEYGLCFRNKKTYTELYSNHSWEESHQDKDFSAFTVGELGLLLPKASDWKSGIDAAGNHNTEPYVDFFCQSYKYDCKSGTEANARAKQLIFLLENKDD